MTLATGSNRSGFELAFCLLIIYTLLARAFSPHDFMFYYLGEVLRSGSFEDVIPWRLGIQPIHYGVLLLMAAATAALPFLAQFGFERKDL